MQPFLPWLGGKRRMVPLLLEKLPPTVETYYEPFLGGGALFFGVLLPKGASSVPSSRTSTLSLSQPISPCETRLMRLSSIFAVMHSIAQTANTSKNLAQTAPSTLSSAERAARFLLLVSCSFRSLYRVNRQGLCVSAPNGRPYPLERKTPELQKASRLLQGADIRCTDFGDVLKDIAPNDAAFFDPPYVPVPDRMGRPLYSTELFGTAEHNRLNAVFAQAAKVGAQVLMTNSDCPHNRYVYSNFAYDVVETEQPALVKKGSRGSAATLLVYGLKKHKEAA